MVGLGKLENIVAMVLWPVVVPCLIRAERGYRNLAAPIPRTSSPPSPQLAASPNSGPNVGASVRRTVRIVDIGSAAETRGLRALLRRRIRQRAPARRGSAVEQNGRGRPSGGTRNAPLPQDGLCPERGHRSRHGRRLDAHVSGWKPGFYERTRVRNPSYVSNQQRNPARRSSEALRTFAHTTRTPERKRAREAEGRGE